MPASAAVPRVYEGETSQGKALTAAFSKSDSGGLRLQGITFNTLKLTCSVDGSVERWGIGAIWRRGLPLDGRTLTIDEVDSEFAWHVAAKVRATHIAGSLLRFSHAALTADELPQICTTGDLTWTATRTVPTPATAEGPSVGTSFTRAIRGATIMFTRLR